MNFARFECCEPRRLTAVQAAGVLNGIEYLEVSDRDAPSPDLAQRTLYVRLLLPAAGLGVDNVSISGGDRIRTVGVEWVAPADSLPPGEDPSLVAGVSDPATMLLIRTDSRGDFSRYELALVAPGTDTPPVGFDPLLARVDFSFKVECEADFDCRVECRCPRHHHESPPIDYTAKDFGSFRRLILDRLSLLAPDWTERNPADLGVMLVELLAYLGDELSYRQDAAHTDGYLETARRRTSLRRLARLVDYTPHDGASARVWATITPLGDGVAVPAGTAMLTRVPGIPERVEPGGRDHREALAGGAETFETVESAVLYAGHDRFDFWTWGDAACCLAVGSTSATLVGEHPHLKSGDVLILSEVAGPETGQPEDADPARRQAVRLTRVIASSDPSGGLFANPVSNDPVPVTEITWDPADALTFPLCISVEDLPGVAVSQALGNVVLADHGRSVHQEDLGSVPGSALDRVQDPSAHCEDRATQPIPGRFRPRLANRPLTNSHPSPWVRLADGPTNPGLEAELAALAVGAELQAWLIARGVAFTDGAPSLQGGDGVWSISDGRTVVRLVQQGASLLVLDRPPPAASIATGHPGDASPAIELTGTTPTGVDRWAPRSDLLASTGDSREFVVEVEHDRTASIRFGDGVHGRRPQVATMFTADYRVGNGRAGNIGADALGHIVTPIPSVSSVTNPLPGRGGIDLEPAEAIRRDAPEAFLVQERAVTEADYAAKAELLTDVQRAAASMRWTGSWSTVFVTADRVGGLAVEPEFETGLRDHLERFRMAGYDLEVDGPTYVPLQVELVVCVLGDHFRSHVHAAVRDRLTSEIRSDGTLGLFHPDRFSFAQPVYLSTIIAEVQGVAGVQSVVANRFGRLHDPESDGLATGVLEMGRLEIARLDDDPNFPERGVLTIEMGGGK